MKSLLIATASLVATFAFSVAASAAPAKMMKTTEGEVLVDARGMTLYTVDKDAKPGDVTGEGVGGVWHVAK